VLHDLLGLETHRPKFLKTYLEGKGLIEKALNAYDHDVKKGTFPGPEHCY
jgi:3-methyl-2-oxobutanoate hydroxymethyltransferase